MRTSIFIVVISLGMLLTVSNSWAETSVQSSTSTTVESIEIFPLGAYWPWEAKRTDANAKMAGLDKWTYVDKVMAILKENHFNFIWVIHMRVHELPQFCKLAEKHSLKVAASPDFDRQMKNYSPEEVGRVVKRIVDIWKESPALVGYVGIDEPKADELDLTNEIYRAVKSADSSRLFLSVIRPHEISLAIPRLKQKIITTDPYDFFHPGVQWFINGNQASMMRRHDRRVSIAAGLAEEYGKTLWIMPQAFEGAWPGKTYYDLEKDKIALVPGSILNFRMCSPVELKWQIWHALQYGIKGIIPFVLLDPPKLDKKDFIKKFGKDFKLEHDNPRGLKETFYLDKDYALITQGLHVTPQLKTVGECYRQIAPVQGILSKLKRNYSLVFMKNPGRITTFSGGNGQFYAIPVNNSLKNAVNARIYALPCVRGVKDMVKGTILNEISSDRKNSPMKIFEINLSPGQGTLLELTTENNCSSELLQMAFDKNVQPGAKLVNLKIVQDPYSSKYCLRVDRSVESYVEFDMDHWMKKKFAPVSYPDGSIYLRVHGDGNLLCQFYAKGNKLIIEKLWGELPLELPRKTTRIRIKFLTRETLLNSFSLIYCKNTKN